jgi:hypothetical protein
MLAFLAATLILAAPAPASAGPPTRGFPLDIGDSRSLPWGEGAWGADAQYDLRRLPGDTYDILLRSDDPLVHAETLRRAVVYLTGAGEARAKPSVQVREELLAALFEELEFDRDVHGAAGKAASEKLKAACEGAKACDKPAAGAVGAAGVRHWVAPLEPAWGGRTCQAQGRPAELCYFDVGYLRAALREAGAPRPGDGAAELRVALALDGADPRLQLVAGLGLLDHPDAAARAEGWKLLDSAAAVPEDSPARAVVRSNLLATAGRMLNVKDHEQLVDRIRQHLAPG